MSLEARLFNPFVMHGARTIGFITDFSRANRRLHNKSFTADNQVTVVGGRNIGDENFDAAHGFVFVDLDVMAVGPLVQSVSHTFDTSWASGSSYPVDRLLPPVDPALIAELPSTASLIEHDPAAAAYPDALHYSPLIHDLLEGRLAQEWAPTRMISDDPAKGQTRPPGAAFDNTG